MRIHLKPGESRQVKFTLTAADVPAAKVDVRVGGGQPIGSTPCVKGSL